MLRVCISIRASKAMEGAWNLFLPGKQNLLHPPPPGKLSRSRQYRVNQFKLFKSMYPWFWSLSLISLSLSLFFSLCYTYQFICPYKISYSSKQISYMCSSKQISYSYDEIRTSSEQAYSKKIILCPKISTDPELCYYTSWTAWFGTLYKWYCLFCEQYGFLCERYG